MAWTGNCCSRLQCCRLVNVTLRCSPWKIHEEWYDLLSKVSDHLLLLVVILNNFVVIFNNVLALMPCTYGARFLRLQCSICYTSCLLLSILAPTVLGLLVQNFLTELATHLQWHMDGVRSAWAALANPHDHLECIMMPHVKFGPDLLKTGCT